MSQKLSIQKTAYGSNSYQKTINTTFTELVPPPSSEQEPMNVEDFFALYEELFFQIPISGETNSHEYLVKTSLEYIGAPVVSDNERALLEEINDLRRQLLELSRNNLI